MVATPAEASAKPRISHRNFISFSAHSVTIGHDARHAQSLAQEYQYENRLFESGIPPGFRTFFHEAVEKCFGFRGGNVEHQNGKNQQGPASNTEICHRLNPKSRALYADWFPVIFFSGQSPFVQQKSSSLLSKPLVAVVISSP